MTKVLFKNKANRYSFKCIGHTGYADRGKDILCSAVSTLCYTLRTFLREEADKGNIKFLSYNFQDGSAIIEFELNKRNNSTLNGVRAVIIGFELLCTNFPEYINIQKQ